MAGSTTLHLHTDGLSSSAQHHHRQYHQHRQGQGQGGAPNEADYAAVTPTAARPHPEESSTMALFDAFIPPQYAYAHAQLQRPISSFEDSTASMMAAAAASPFPVYQQQLQRETIMAPAAYLNAHHHHQDVSPSAYPALSSCSSSSESSGTGGPSTPPSTASSGSSPSLLAFSSSGVPGNTIYSAYNNNNMSMNNAYAPQYNHTVYSGSNAASTMVAMQPAQDQHHQGHFIQQQHHVQQQQQACYDATSQYAPHQQLVYPPYQPGFYNNQYAIYNGNTNEVMPSVLQAVPPGNISQPTSAQISPNMTYNTIQMNDTTHSRETSNSLPSVLSSINVDAFSSVDNTMNASLNMATFQPHQEQPSYRSHGQGHSHSASLSSISSTNSLSGSPAPSLSGSDDSGNTTKSTLSRLSVLSGGGTNDQNRSNPSSRRGSVSSNAGHATAGMPYSLSSRKDGGDKKFVCSYPGCSRAFSRNFNLSTHYNTHLGIKPFPCTHCPKSFSRRHDCARHIAAVHASEAGKLHHSVDDREVNLSPTSCGCGHTCPAHKLVPSYDTTTVPTSYNGPMRTTSAFAFIKGEPMEDDLLSSTSSTASGYASGYESTTSSIDSFIGRFGAMDATTNLVAGDLNDNTRSPSLSSVSNNTGYIDVGRIKIEDGEGE